jgi:BirA family biotin operon repressor/biotin-[acetyl-CoA-carboxylase] ligase
MFGSDKIFLEQVDSTNRYLMDKLTQERPGEGTLVWAGHQTAGRGMDNNTWESAPGMNLTFSVVIYPDFLGADQQFYLNKVVSLALADVALEILPGKDIRIKWPNDLYAGDHKLAGMLIQNGVKGNRFEYSVIGIGLNVNQVEFQEEVANPVSLKVMSGRDFDLHAVLDRILEALDHRYGMLIRGERAMLDRDYTSAMYRYGVVAGYNFRGKDIRARISGVNRYGQLMLEIPGEKILECDLKDVKFII